MNTAEAVARLKDRYGPDVLQQLYDMAMSPDPEPPAATPAEAFREEGRAEGRVDTLTRVLTARFGPLPDSLLRTVRGASGDQVEDWTASAVVAETLDQVLETSVAASNPADSPSPPDQPTSLDSVYQQILGMSAVEGSALLRAGLDQGGQELFAGHLEFIAGTSLVSARELHDLAASVGPDAENAYLTTARMFRAEGRIRGQEEALCEVLKVKFGTLSLTVLLALMVATGDEIEAWTARAMTIETLDQIFD